MPLRCQFNPFPRHYPFHRHFPLPYHLRLFRNQFPLHSFCHFSAIFCSSTIFHSTTIFHSSTIFHSCIIFYFPIIFYVPFSSTPTLSFTRSSLSSPSTSSSRPLSHHLLLLCPSFSPVSFPFFSIFISRIPLLFTNFLLLTVSRFHNIYSSTIFFPLSIIITPFPI